MIGATLHFFFRGNIASRAVPLFSVRFFLYARQGEEGELRSKRSSPGGLKLVSREDAQGHKEKKEHTVLEAYGYQRGRWESEKK